LVRKPLDILSLGRPKYSVENVKMGYEKVGGVSEIFMQQI